MSDNLTPMSDNLTIAASDHDRDNTHSGDIESGRAFQMDPRDLPADHPSASIANDRTGGLYVRQGVTSEQHGDAPPPADPEYIASQSPALIVAQVESRIAKLEQQLATNTGFHPTTGEPIPLVAGRARENAVRELAQLKHSTLPFARIQAAEIARAKAALPTQADKLQAEKDHRDRVQARAEELALEAEAEELAARIRKAARLQSMG